jgi:hypothetical protein
MSAFRHIVTPQITIEFVNQIGKVCKSCSHSPDLGGFIPVVPALPVQGFGLVHQNIDMVPAFLY